MEAGALSYCWGKYQEIRVYLVVPGRTERVPSIVVQFAVWVSYNTDFVSVMTSLCITFSADDGFYPTGLFYGYQTRSEPWSLDGSGNRAC